MSNANSWIMQNNNMDIKLIQIKWRFCHHLLPLCYSSLCDL